ncbi:unnamed protein product [Thelazia callipaeda]|uniref:SCP domain-containing protein n=1 Tax=Thelazia callipaeda TaxID=103827 RepID=A0A158RCG0_THECL|nr:unnamed protein product [Thelazia callipaeda]
MLFQSAKKSVLGSSGTQKKNELSFLNRKKLRHLLVLHAIKAVDREEITESATVVQPRMFVIVLKMPKKDGQHLKAVLFRKQLIFLYGKDSSEVVVNLRDSNDGFYKLIVHYKKDTILEIIMQKYKALGASEISEIKNERYDFRFCACDSETKEPENTTGCSCSTVITGLANLLYTKIKIGARSLTDPPYQLITNSRFKNTAFLSCSRNSYCEDCIPCKSGYIQLNYISLFSSSVTASKQMYVQDTAQPDKAKQWPTMQLKKLSTTEISIDDFNSIAKIKEYLLRSAKKRNIPPSEFNIVAYKDAILLRHNVYRSRHGVAPLNSDSELEQNAETWAQRLANKTDCLIHDPFGENIFYYATDLLPDEETMALMTVQSFYLESYGYNYKTHHHLDYERKGHFTQLIWKSTLRMGVGVAMRYFSGHRENSCQPDFPSTIIYAVVKYDPPGNILSMTQYDDNVLPP